MILLSLSLSPATIFAAEKNSPSTATNSKEVPAAVKVMYDRLEEIKAIDKSSMTSVEKKNFVKKFELLMPI